MKGDKTGDERLERLREALTEEGAGEFPGGIAGERLLARAKAALGLAPPSLASLVATARGAAISLSGGAGRLGEVLAPRLLRGDGEGGVLLGHSLGGRELKTAIAPTGDGRFRVVLDLGSDAAERRARVTVLKDDREHASESARRGRVLLPTLSPGRWRLRITEGRGWVGDLDLDLVVEAP